MFVRGPNPIWFFSNLIGQPFDDTYYAFFLTNDLPYVPQAVFQDPNGTIPWSNPLEFQPSSGLPNNLYFDPTLVYRIEFRQGPTQSDPLIYLVQDYTLAGESEKPVADALTFAENLITNPQFADVYFTTPLVITTAGTYDIAPGWQLVLGGGGTCTVSQNENPGSSDIFGNPPYYLTINNNSFLAELVQKFSNNGAIFSGGAAAITFSSFVSSPPQPLTVSYEPSTGSGIILFNGQIISSAFNVYQGANNITASTNTDSGEDAFVDIVFQLPQGTTNLTNIQLVGQSVPLSSGFNPMTDIPQFAELTYERIVDHEFHVYRNSLLMEPKDNLLVGWTFALNPWQFTTTSSTNVAANQYTADQTIIIQQAYVASATGNNVAVGKSTASNNDAFAVTAVTANNQFAILQYIDPKTIAPYWGQVLSCLVKADLVTSHSSTATFKMRLIYKAGLPGTLSQTEPVATWTAGQDPIFAAGWTAIKPLNDPEYVLGNLDTDVFVFDRFELPASSNANMTLGVIIYTTENMDQASTADVVLFHRVSLVPNDFAIDASTETYDETFRKCQYYYETSYLTGAAIGTVTNAGMKNVLTPLNANGASSGINMFGRTFEIEYDQIKRSATPLVKIYSPTSGTTAGTLGTISCRVWNGTGNEAGPTDQNVDSFFTQLENSYKNVIYQPNTTTQLLGSFTDLGPNQGMIEFHYTTDARLGLVL